MWKTLLIARKFLTEYLREVQLLALTLGLPLFFVIIMALGYGTAPKLSTYAVGVVDPQKTGDDLATALSQARYYDGRPVFHLEDGLQGAALDEALKSRRLAAVVIFSEGPDGYPEAAVRGDATSMPFILASAKLDEVLGAALNRQRGKPELLRLTLKPLDLRAPQNEFEVYAPGVVLFGLMFLMPLTAMMVGRELRTGALRRMLLTPLTAAQYLGGIALAQMAIAAVQVLLVVGGLLAFGFPNRGSLPDVFVIGLLVSLGAVGMGLVLSAFTNNDSDALNTGGAVVMVILFLSGALFSMPLPEMFTLGGYSISLADFLPPAHAMLALQQVMSGGASLGQVAFRSLAAGTLSLAYFAASLVIFNRVRRR